jgi:hypothetical protein
MRALHLELSSDTSVDKFLMALERFVSCQGLPTLFTPITPHSKQLAENLLRYVPSPTTYRQPATSHIDESPGNSLPHRQLGGEDGGSER